MSKNKIDVDAMLDAIWHRLPRELRWRPGALTQAKAEANADDFMADADALITESERRRAEVWEEMRREDRNAAPGATNDADSD